MTLTTPLRRTILHLSHIFFTDALTFMTLRLPDDSAARQIPRRQLHDDPIADQEPDEISLQTTADMCRDSPTPVDVDPIQPARQLRFNDPLLHERLATGDL